MSSFSVLELEFQIPAFHQAGYVPIVQGCWWLNICKRHWKIVGKHKGLLKWSVIEKIPWWIWSDLLHNLIFHGQSVPSFAIVPCFSSHAPLIFSTIRLLKEMGWQEYPENDENYLPLTEDELKEFQIKSEQVCLQFLLLMTALLSLLSQGLVLKGVQKDQAFKWDCSKLDNSALSMCVYTVKCGIRVHRGLVTVTLHTFAGFKTYFHSYSEEETDLGRMDFFRAAAPACCSTGEALLRQRLRTQTQKQVAAKRQMTMPETGHNKIKINKTNPINSVHSSTRVWGCIN